MLKKGWKCLHVGEWRVKEKNIFYKMEHQKNKNSVLSYNVCSFAD